MGLMSTLIHSSTLKKQGAHCNRSHFTVSINRTACQRHFPISSAQSGYGPQTVASEQTRANGREIPCRATSAAVLLVG
jgi:hypothetical protein